MARYLLVAHETATDPLVVRRTREIQSMDPAAAFTILVPETHVQHRFVCDEVETRQAARRRASAAEATFRRAGLRVLRAGTGSSSPIQAIDDELRLRPGDYDAIVLSTFPPGVSRWLRMDLPARTERTHSLPVFHIYEDGDDAWEETAALRRQVAHGRRAAPGPRRIDRVARDVPTWAVAALLALHVALMLGLAYRNDMRFVAYEVIAVAIWAVFFAGLWWGDRGPALRWPRPR